MTVAKAVHGVKRGSSGTGKWIIFGVLGVLVVLRAWQRYKENVL
jgi:predicted negative regulator of RcsB-dependent stress response